MNLLYANDKTGEYPPSYYAATKTNLPAFAPLRGEVRADVCVVGGGYTGLSAALHLAEKGYAVTLLEAHKIGFGASGRNGGQVGSGQRQDQNWVEKAVGLTQAHRLWDLAEESKSLVKSLIQKHNMPVTFHPGVAHACWTDTEVRDTHAYAEKLKRDYNYPHLEPLDRDGIQRLIVEEDAGVGEQVRAIKRQRGLGADLQAANVDAADLGLTGACGSAYQKQNCRQAKQADWVYAWRQGHGLG